MSTDRERATAAYHARAFSEIAAGIKVPVCECGHIMGDGEYEHMTMAFRCRDCGRIEDPRRVRTEYPHRLDGES